jgi:hypothetical protein
MALITQQEVEDRLGRDLSTAEQSAFSIINEAVQAYVEDVLIGSSVEDVSATARQYDGGLQNVTIDPCTDISSVQLVDNFGNVEYTYQDEDYDQEPVNRTLKSTVRHLSGKFTNGPNRLKVTAKFSIYNDAGTLAIVKNALISAIVTEVQARGNIKSESIEGYSITYMDKHSREALSEIKSLFPAAL